MGEIHNFFKWDFLCHVARPLLSIFNMPLTLVYGKDPNVSLKKKELLSSFLSLGPGQLYCTT